MIAATLALVAGVSSVYGICLKQYDVVCQNYNDWMTNVSYPSPTCGMTYTTGAYAETTVYKPDVRILGTGKYPSAVTVQHTCRIPVKYYNSCISNYDHGTINVNLSVLQGQGIACSP